MDGVALLAKNTLAGHLVWSEVYACKMSGVSRQRRMALENLSCPKVWSKNAGRLEFLVDVNKVLEISCIVSENIAFTLNICDHLRCWWQIFHLLESDPTEFHGTVIQVLYNDHQGYGWELDWGELEPWANPNNIWNYSQRNPEDYTTVEYREGTYTSANSCATYISLFSSIWAS